mmetsp:Transcript_18922/g.63842  ORF Transcript_18922/g.63842 Transcript_18922/m.63842 type:complete len:391 (-) Transcript_18922:266-1438(-)
MSACASRPPGTDAPISAAAGQPPPPQEQTVPAETSAPHVPLITLDEQTFTSAESLYTMMEDLAPGKPAPVKLLRWSWVAKRAAKLRAATTDAERAALALPRRQELELEHPEAFLPLAELRSWGVHKKGGQYPRYALKLGAVSHAWETASHPDPRGAKLIELDRLVGQAQCIELDAQKFDGVADQDQRLPEEFALFFDWASLHQKDAAGCRQPAEREAFNAALETMQLWYAHKLTFAIILRDVQSDVPYDARGWPSVEALWIGLVKIKTPYLWPPILDASSPSGEPKRTAPLHPDRIEALLETKTFTSPKADRPIVARLYRETALTVFSSAVDLLYCGCGWGDEEAISLASVLPLCQKLKYLNVNRNPKIGSRGMRALTEAAEKQGFELVT